MFLDRINSTKKVKVMPTPTESRQRAKTERLQAHKIDKNNYTVYNVIKHTKYSVMRAVNGSWHCTCPYMTLSNRIAGVCKHIIHVQDRAEGCVDCKSHHELQRIDGDATQPFICKMCKESRKYG